MDKLSREELIEFNKFIEDWFLEDLDYEKQREIFDSHYRHRVDNKPKKKENEHIFYFDYGWD